jgi:hypothetical protein
MDGTEAFASSLDCEVRQDKAGPTEIAASFGVAVNTLGNWRSGRSEPRLAELRRVVDRYPSLGRFVVSDAPTPGTTAEAKSA